MEVTFSGSLAGSLKAARRSAEKLSDQIQWFDRLYLDMGDLTDGVFSEKRLRQLYSFFDNPLTCETARMFFRPRVLLKEKAKVEQVKAAA